MKQSIMVVVLIMTYLKHKGSVAKNMVFLIVDPISNNLPNYKPTFFATIC